MTVPDRPETLLAQRTWLLALARQLAGRDDLAEDLAHDTLTAAVTAPLPQRAGPRAWLAAILRRQLAGRRRADARRTAREAAAARPEAQPSASDTVLRFELQRTVAEAVLALPEPYRTTVLLRFWDGLSPGAIARQLCVPIETVRTRLKRGLQQLRERLDRTYGGDRSAWLMPLLALRPASLAASIVTGVLLMHTVSKLLVLVAVLAALLLMVDAPRTAPDAAPGTRVDASPTVPVAVVPDALSLINTPGDRVAAAPTPTAAAARLEVAGVVVDDDSGEPLAGCDVQLLGWPEPIDGELRGSTADDGSFVLHDARSPHGSRQIIVRAAERAPARLLVPWQPDQPDAHDFQRIDLGPIRVAAGTLFAGSVVTSTRAPVADAELWLPSISMGYAGGGPQNMLEYATRVGRSDAHARFMLSERIVPDLQHGNLLFAIASEGIGWTTFTPSRQRRSVDDLELQLRPNGSLRVRVVTARGTPVPAAIVRAMPRFGPLGIEQHWRTAVSREPSIAARFVGRTDALGTTVLTLPIGDRTAWTRSFDEFSYELSIEAEPFGTQPLLACKLQADTIQELTVQLLEQRDVRVDVVVIDDLGAPVSDAKVAVHGEVEVTGRSDAHGHAQVVVPVVGSASITVSCAGHRTARQGLEIHPDTRQSRFELVLVRTLPLDGRVVDQTGAPVPDTSIFVGHQHLATSDADGRFHVEDFPVGSQRLIAALPANAERTRWIGEQQPETVDAAAGPVVITLQRRLGEVDLLAHIVDAERGQALELADLSVRRFEPAIGHFVEMARANHDHGVVTAKALPAGRWRLDVRTVSGRRGSREFELNIAQPPCELRLELPEPGTVIGRLRFDGTAPTTVRLDVRFATIDATRSVQYHFPGRWHPEGPQTVVDDHNGRVGQLQLQPGLNAAFRLESVDPTSDLRFRVMGDGVTGEATLRVAPGESREVVIDVRRAAK